MSNDIIETRSKLEYFLGDIKNAVFCKMFYMVGHPGSAVQRGVYSYTQLEYF